MVRIFNLPHGMGVFFFRSVLTSSNPPFVLPKSKKKKKKKSQTNFRGQCPPTFPPPASCPPTNFQARLPHIPPYSLSQNRTKISMPLVKGLFTLDWNLSVGLVCPAHQYGSSRFHPSFRNRWYKVPRIGSGERSATNCVTALAIWTSRLSLSFRRPMLHDCKLGFRRFRSGRWGKYEDE